MRKPRLPAGRGAPRLVRLIAVTATLAVALVLSAGAATHAAATSSTGLLGGEPLCESHHSLCRDAFKTPGDEYVGHDEPSVAFRSSEPGSANDMTFHEDVYARLGRERPRGIGPERS
jgi:hypothetical protein